VLLWEQPVIVAVGLLVALGVILWRTGLLPDLLETAHRKAATARDRAEVEQAAAAVEAAVVRQAVLAAREERARAKLAAARRLESTESMADPSRIEKTD
jgi:hypothetical protein